MFANQKTSLLWTSVALLGGLGFSVLGPSALPPADLGHLGSITPEAEPGQKSRTLQDREGCSGQETTPCHVASVPS